MRTPDVGIVIAPDQRGLMACFAQSPVSSGSRQGAASLRRNEANARSKPGCSNCSANCRVYLSASAAPSHNLAARSAAFLSTTYCTKSWRLPVTVPCAASGDLPQSATPGRTRPATQSATETPRCTQPRWPPNSSRPDAAARERQRVKQLLNLPQIQGAVVLQRRCGGETLPNMS